MCVTQGFLVLHGHVAGEEQRALWVEMEAETLIPGGNDLEMPRYPPPSLAAACCGDPMGPVFVRIHRIHWHAEHC